MKPLKGRLNIVQALRLLPGRYRPGARAAFNAMQLRQERSYYHGASLARGKRIFAIGRNNANKTHPEGVDEYSTVHAETQLLANLRFLVQSNMICFVVRVSSTRHYITTARPCESCMKNLIQKGVKVVIYTTCTGWQIEKIA